MNEQFAKDHLNLVLSFFPRVDSTIALLTGLEVAMLGYLAPQVPEVSKWRGLDPVTMFALLGTVLAIGWSFVVLCRAAFPVLEGGEGSLIYFRAIVKRTALRFSDEYKAANEAVVLDDLIEQIWRNSSILTLKYDRLKQAFVTLAIGILFWLLALTLL